MIDLAGIKFAWQIIFDFFFIRLLKFGNGGEFVQKGVKVITNRLFVVRGTKKRFKLILIQS